MVRPTALRQFFTVFEVLIALIMSKDLTFVTVYYGPIFKQDMRTPYCLTMFEYPVFLTVYK
jgi:hypothetical protein